MSKKNLISEVREILLTKMFEQNVKCLDDLQCTGNEKLCNAYRKLRFTPEDLNTSDLRELLYFLGIYTIQLKKVCLTLLNQTK